MLSDCSVRKLLGLQPAEPGKGVDLPQRRLAADGEVPLLPLQPQKSHTWSLRQDPAPLNERQIGGGSEELDKRDRGGGRG